MKQAWHVLEPGTPFVDGIHVDAICDHLQAMIEDRIKDLIINIPPGFAKSMIAAVFFPAWVWIKHPEYRFLYASYKAEYAIRDSVKCRTLIQSHWYQDRWGDRFQLKTDQNEKSEVRERSDRLPRNHIGRDGHGRPRHAGLRRRSDLGGPGGLRCRAQQRQQLVDRNDDDPPERPARPDI